MLICLDCLDECEEIEFRDGFFYDYGSIRGAWHDESGTGSSCCHGETAQGRIWLNRTSKHVARKDHLSPAGNLWIAKGETYINEIKKGYYIDTLGDHIGIFETNKYKVRK